MSLSDAGEGAAIDNYVAPSPGGHLLIPSSPDNTIL